VERRGEYPVTTTLEHRAVAATWWSAIEITARYGVQFVVMIVLARLLTPADFGLIAMLLVFTTIAALFVEGGFGTALIQRIDTSDDDETTVFAAGIVVSSTAAAILWLAAPAIAAFYVQPQLAGLMRLILFVLPIGAFVVVPDALLTQRLDFRSRAKAEAIASVLSGSAAIGLAWYGFGVWSLAWQAIIAITTRAILLWRLSGWRPRGRVSSTSFRSLLKFGGFVLMANLLSTTSSRLQSLLIGKMFDARALGYYVVAQNTQYAPTQFLSGVLNRVGLPVFSSIADRPRRLHGALQLSLRVAMFAFVPCMVGLAVVAKPVITVLYGTAWQVAAPLLSVLCLAAVFWPLHVLNLAAVSARGRSDMVFKLEVAKGIASIACITAGSLISVIAVAWAVFASSVIAVCVNTWYSHKLLGYGLLAQLRDQSATLLLSALASGAAWLASHWLHHAPLALATAIVTAVATYFGLAALLRVTAWRDLLTLFHAWHSPGPMLKDQST
jgi:O-antigen/teichoic acid export membrane protein